MNIVLLGAPGAGKGSLANLLKDSLGIVHISTGDILREEIRNNSDLGVQAKGFIDRGQLVPDEVVTKLIEHKINSDRRVDQGFMLDGYPRTLKQAQDLDQILVRAGKPLQYVLDLESTVPVIIQRLGGRRVCKQCGAIFHIKNKPSKKDAICDLCQGPLYQRPDDNPVTIETRMKVYLQATKPIVEYYQNQGILISLDSDRETIDLHENLIQNLQLKG